MTLILVRRMNYHLGWMISTNIGLVEDYVGEWTGASRRDRCKHTVSEVTMLHQITRKRRGLNLELGLRGSDDVKLPINVMIGTSINDFNSPIMKPTELGYFAVQAVGVNLFNLRRITDLSNSGHR